MTEQIYINGILMDCKSGSPVSLVFQSPFFTDIDNIVSNRTNSVSFPATKNNLAAIDRAHLSKTESKFAYRRHKVLYFRDGIQIFSGLGTLLSITPTDLKFTFTWGNVSTFQSLLDYRLRDLRALFNEQDILVPWNETAVKTNSYYASNITTGRYNHPIMKVSLLLENIERVCGVTFEGKEVFDDYRIPVISNQADDAAKIQQGVIMGDGLARITYQYRYWYFLLPTKDIRGLHRGSGIIDVSNFETLKITFNVGFSYSIASYSGNQGQSIGIYACDSGGQNLVPLASLPLTKTGSARLTYTLTSSTKEVVLNVEDYSYIRICVFRAGTAQTSNTPTMGLCIANVIPDYDKEQELIFGGVYPLFQNLPDWTVLQLLKNLMKLEGLFASCPDSKTIRFISIDELYKNRTKAFDVTDKLVLQDGAPDEKTFTYGDYARNNVFKYAEDDTVLTNADGILPIDDTTLDDTKDILTLDFAASDEVNGRVKIPVYSQDEEGNYEYEEITPRILVKSPESSSSTQEVLTFKGLDWNSLIATKYANFANSIQNAKVLKASLIINSVELSHLELTVPVYSYVLGHYFAILSMTTKEDGLAEVELLQLGEEKQEETAGTGDLNLAVIQNADGDYVATLTNRNTSQINAIRADETYKVCLIRYGYARRGKFFTYVDKTGKKVTTKTSRKVKYDKETGAQGHKNVRFEEGGGTPCWRIIGHDILYNGKLGSHSQVRGYYADTTLVFDLLDPIALPPMRTDCVGKSGRIRNKADDGLAELSIALYHRNDIGRWEVCSNICPVRSRTESKLQYWEFNSSNVLDVQ